MMLYPEELHTEIQDISIVVSKTEIFATSSTSTPEYTYYEYFYIPFFQFFYVVILILMVFSIVNIFLKLTKKR
jgi:hypothetical protein